LNGLPTGRVIGQGMKRMVALSALLLPWAAPVTAADPVGAVAPAHGPMLMIYITQPLMSGASRIYGVRLDQIAQNPQVCCAAMAANGLYAASPQRSLVDLQIRRRADVRVEFGDRLTWNMRSREFEFPNAHAAKPINFVASSLLGGEAELFSRYATAPASQSRLSADRR
jgi:hypothetical protein